MSFILDALRKSEAARRRNETPDLFTAMPQRIDTAATRVTWSLWVIGGVGLLSLVAAVWLFLFRVPSIPPQSAASAAPAEVQTPAPGASPVAGGLPTIPTSPMPGPRAGTQPHSGPAVVSVPPPITAAPSQTSLQMPVATARPPQSPSSAMQGLPTAPPEPPPSPASRPTPQNNADATLALSNLDPGTRKQLPPLKISMHMWNETPSRRFVIVDGQRLGEGDMLGNVMVESITRDGVVVDWQGSRLRVDMH